MYKAFHWNWTFRRVLLIYHWIILFSEWMEKCHDNTSTWFSQLCRKVSWVTHLLSRATLLPRTQLSCSWTHSAVLCKSAARPPVGGGLGLLWLASELRLRDVMDGCCLCGGGAGGRGGGPCWADRWSPGDWRKKRRHRNISLSIFNSGKIKQKAIYNADFKLHPELRKWIAKKNPDGCDYTSALHARYGII